MDGLINVNKPVGFTSHDVVAKLRGILSNRRIGHTGTLDPDATGVLPICVGVATKAAEFLTAEVKEYIAEVTLGAETDTQDASGTVLRRASVQTNEAEICAAVQQFVGTQPQIPPMYSAIKQDGKRLYELAREGKTVERKPRMVTIHEITVLSFDLEQHKFSMRVRCSKGTYIRTLCRDIGVSLGCYAHMSALCRTQSGSFRIENAYTIAQIEAMVHTGDLSFLMPTDRAFDALPALYLSERKAQRMCNGVRVSTPGMEEGRTYRVYDEKGDFLTVSKAENGVLKIEKTFYQGIGKGE